MNRTFSGLVIFAAILALAPAVRADELEDLPGKMVTLDLLTPGAFLGVTTLDVTPELRTHLGAPKDAGVLVGTVVADAPAGKAGIQVGDVIVRVDGHGIDSPWGLARALRDRKAGDTVSIEIVRDRAARTLSAKLVERDRGPGMVIRKRRAAGRERTEDGDFDRFETMFMTPQWQGRLDNVEECEKVRDRLKMVEDRLHALEQRLEKK